MQWSSEALDIQDSAFSELLSTRDVEIKHLQQKGIGSKKRKAKPLTEEDEVLWKKGLLGDHSPQAILNTNDIHEWPVFCPSLALGRNTENCVSNLLRW